MKCPDCEKELECRESVYNSAGFHGNAQESNSEYFYCYSCKREFSFEIDENTLSLTPTTL